MTNPITHPITGHFNGPEKLKVLHFANIPADLHHNAKVAAARRRISLRDLVVEALERELRRLDDLHGTDWE